MPLFKKNLLKIEKEPKEETKEEEKELYNKKLFEQTEEQKVQLRLDLMQSIVKESTGSKKDTRIL